MKKILAIALVLVFTLGTMVSTSAATTKIVGFTDGALAVLPDTVDWDVGDVRPGQILRYHIGTVDTNPITGPISSIFEVEGTQPVPNDWSAWLRLMKQNNVRCRVRSGGKIVDNVSFKYYPTSTDGYGASGPVTNLGNAIWAEFELIDPYVSVEETDFEIEAYLELNGKRTDDLFKIVITGTLANEVTEVFADSVEADTWQGQVIDAQEYVGKITLVGNKDEDVFAHIKMANGKKVYFVVNTEGDAKDEPIMDKYPSIEFAYTVLSVGLSGTSGNFIELAGVDEAYYVYGKNADGSLKYLGRGGELLPFSVKYYVSSAKLDLDDDVIEDLPEEDDVPGPSYNPSTGI